MGLNNTVSADRLHIGFFGIRNAGKSSIVNAVTGQELSVVSPIGGTTTDPVRKAMELLPLGPVEIIDTPGIDDTGSLGDLRVKKTKQILDETDIAVLVTDCTKPQSDADRELISLFEEKKLPYITVLSKADLSEKRGIKESNTIYASALTGEGIEAIKNKLGEFASASEKQKPIVSDLLSSGNTVILVIPIDAAAPKGRIILPQQQVLRELLDVHCTVIACQDTELKSTLSRLSEKPKLIITDSQAFAKVARDTPDDIPLTSFSILFARYKGRLNALVRGASELSKLSDGDRVLISEGCTHHRQCGDIGTVKLPSMIKRFCGAEPDFSFTSGRDFPDFSSDDHEYSLVLHCGGCMLNEREMQSRIDAAERAGISVVNYGVAIAHMNGLLRRSLAPLGDDILSVLD